MLKDRLFVLLEENGITLSTNITPKNLKKRMDLDFMLSLFLNLVENACKASKEGSSILLTADETGISVEDFGKGIPKQEVGRVTEAFYMVDKSRTKRGGGAGLGLALCQQIADIHGAKMRIESVEGKGTKVSVLW